MSATTRSKQLFIEALYRPQDKVKYGPHEGSVARLMVSSMGVTYEVTWWIDNEQHINTAYEWELKLIEEAPE